MHENEAKRYIRQEPLPGIGYPHPSNRGVTDTSTPLVWSHLDYFSGTFPYPEMGRRSRVPLTPFWRQWFDVQDEIAGVGWYRSGAKLYPAGRLYWHGAERSRGSYLVMAGEDLAVFRDVHKVTDQQFLQKMMLSSQTVSRLDFCTNIEAGHPRETRKQFKQGKAKTRVKTCLRNDETGKRNGYTMYFGAHGSDKMLRVYDKIAQLRLDGGVWTRIELQLRNEPAQKMAEIMRGEDLKAAGKTAIRDFVDFPELPWYQLAVQSDNIEMNLTPRKETNFMRWLNEQVGPGIEKRIRAGKEVREIAEWLAGMNDLLRAHYGVIEDSKNDQNTEA